MAPTLCFILLLSCWAVVSGRTCYNKEPTQSKCLGYKFSLKPYTKYRQCVQGCKTKSTCALIQWNQKNRFCFLVTRDLVKHLEKGGTNCLHFRKQNCSHRDVAGMTSFSNFAFKGGMLVRGVCDEDDCRSMCSRWEACSAYSFNFSSPDCKLHQDIPPDSGLELAGYQHQGIKRRRYVLETKRSYIFKRVGSGNKYLQSQNNFTRILECVDLCSRLPSCTGITWFQTSNEKNCYINDNDQPMYVKDTTA